jgi:molybdopterin converting factor subunit 1
MELNVLYFAHVRERTGVSRETLQVDANATVGDVVRAIVERYPDLEVLLPSIRVAVDGEFAELSAQVHPGSEVVLIPPISGGSGTPPIALVDDPLDHETLGRLCDYVTDARHGALATFTGVVRDHARGREVDALYYEAYRPMAEKKLREIVAEIEKESSGVRIAVHHRLGQLVVGDVAVQVAVGSAHRKEAFEACALVIDRLKEGVPIWKRETGPDGTEWVSEGA